MVNSDRLAEVVALLAERDEEFTPFKDGQQKLPDHDEVLWELTYLKSVLGYEENENIAKAVNRAKVTAEAGGVSIKENFVAGDLFSKPGEIYLTKYAALLVTVHADVNKPRVALAKHYFAIQVDRQQLENEKRIRTRLDVTTENNKLTDAAKEKGVSDFQKFNGMGIAALYGGRNVAEIRKMKGLKAGQQHLDYAGSEELAANLFRITQTAAALRRQEVKSEAQSCRTHSDVAANVRRVIVDAGNTPPEQLPVSDQKVDTRLSTKVKKSIEEQRNA